MNREVDGILIDTYAGGTRKDLFSKPSIQVAQIIDYQTAYGVVIGGDSMRLRHCFYGYMRSHQAEIFEFVEQLVEPITVRTCMRQGLVKFRSKFSKPEHAQSPHMSKVTGLECSYGKISNQVTEISVTGLARLLI